MHPPDVPRRPRRAVHVLSPLPRQPPFTCSLSVAFNPPFSLITRIRRLGVIVLASAAASLSPLCLTSMRPSFYSFAATSPKPIVVFDRDYANRPTPAWEPSRVLDTPSEASSGIDSEITPGFQELPSPSQGGLSAPRDTTGRYIPLADEIRILCRLLVALTVGGIIGVERRAAKSFAGVRTFSLVSLGAAVFMSTALVAFPTADPARVAAAISSSVGFLGAGVMSKNSKHSRGLTTASSVWLAAALGIAAASGLFVLSYTGAILTVLIARYARFDNSLHLIRGDPLKSPDPPFDDDIVPYHLANPDERLGGRISPFSVDSYAQELHAQTARPGTAFDPEHEGCRSKLEDNSAAQTDV